MSMVQAERRMEQEATKEMRYFLLSFAGKATTEASAVRSPWGIENMVHWVLDVAFREDDSRIRVAHGAHNLAV
jgi:predicted transposase YbfD/YdcC